jgi:hypothetical protein
MTITEEKDSLCFLSAQTVLCFIWNMFSSLKISAYPTFESDHTYAGLLLLI